MKIIIQDNAYNRVIEKHYIESLIEQIRRSLTNDFAIITIKNKFKKQKVYPGISFYTPTWIHISRKNKNLIEYFMNTLDGILADHPHLSYDLKRVWFVSERGMICYKIQWYYIP